MKPQKKDEKVTLLLYRNQFDDKSWVGKIKRDTVSSENVCANIADRDPGVGYAMIIHVLELVQTEILRQIKLGHAVDVLGLGVLYVAPVGKISGTNPQPADIKSFTARFSPSALVREEAKTVKVEITKSIDGMPFVNHVISLKDGNTDGNLTMGRNVRLTGDKLTVGGSGSGIFFAKADESGNIVAEEKNWIAVDTSYLPRNTSKTLEFTVPKGLETSTPYVIVVRTNIHANGSERKTMVQGVSSITVTATADA